MRAGQETADVYALDPKGRKWVFEVKGYPSTYMKQDGSIKSRSSIMSQRRVWITQAFGQIVFSMKQDNARFGLVFPDNPADSYFEKQTVSLPPSLRSKLDLWIMLIAEAGEIRVLDPHNNQYVGWSHAIF